MAFLAAVLAGTVFLRGDLGLDRTVVDGPGLALEAGFFSSILFLVPGFPSSPPRSTSRASIWRRGSPGSRMPLCSPSPPASASGRSRSSPGWNREGGGDRQPPSLGLVLAQMLASFLGVFGFAVIFNSRRWSRSPPAHRAGREPLRLLLVAEGWPAQTSAAIATLVVGLLAWLVGRTTHLPRIILSVPSVVIMIPGVAAFRALAHINDGDLVAGLNLGISSIAAVLGGGESVSSPPAPSPTRSGPFQRRTRRATPPSSGAWRLAPSSG